MAYTPVHVLADGTLAVYVFFVLSGLVLALQAERVAKWRGYYGQRLARLYLPVWGSIAFAGLCALLVTRTVTGTWWLAAHADPLNRTGIVDEMTLTGGVTWLNSALWSLRWEMEFSLLLPLYLLLLAPRMPRLWWAKILLLLAAIAVGVGTGHDSLKYLPMFGCGVILANHRNHLPAIRSYGAAAVSLLALLAAWTYWIVASRGASPATAGPLVSLQVAAAVWVVLAAERWLPVSGWLNSQAPRWLGSRSFALYLVHEPIVVSVALLTHSLLLTLLISVPFSLAVAEGFFRVIEHPSHRMSRTFGRALSGAGRDPVPSLSLSVTNSEAR